MNYMPGTASLIQDIDKKHLVLLRDGRTLIGYLRSIDQFANLVLHQTVERIHVGKKYGDIPRGIFVVRGENVVLLGEIISRCMEFCHCFARLREKASDAPTGRPIFKTEATWYLQDLSEYNSQKGSVIMYNNHGL
ncbi:U6 snRNA-associated Sm-like protein LSm1 isoform X1 [Varanus komodoensis]|uniref:U6 snRNA-associated Sm-like protein LSm1 isoform X1 n=1 Tax=Varanus komodoensis TaxID=61221 RepID=UPI001CF7915A|nr:U6 snRNA-associated Sm-like protein LSm1 isoform X1 [Varanus komodoensis]